MVETRKAFTDEIDGSAQLAELRALEMALEQGATCVYTDSYVVWAGATQWLENWVKNNWQVNGRDTWGKTHWKNIYDIAQSKSISIGHVFAHQKHKNPEAKWNQMADHLARKKMYYKILPQNG